MINSEKQGASIQLKTVQSILEQLPYPLQVIDNNGWTIMISDAMSRTFNVASESLVGEGKHNIFTDSRLKKNGIIQAVKKAFSGERTVLPVVEIDTSSEADTGDFVVRVEAFPIYNGETVEFVGLVYEDITDKISLQRELIAKNEELETFVYTVSHDLKSPLNVITNCVEILKDDLDQQMKDKQLDMILRNTNRMVEFINSILSLSRAGRYADAEEEHRTPLDLIARSLISDFKAEYGNVEVEVNISPLPEVKIHHDDAEHLFQNLIGNAFKYRKPDTPLKLEITYEERERSYLFSFSDNGIGIPLAEQGKVFEVFYRGSNADKSGVIPGGTGVGLAVVKKAIEKNNGKIWLRSKPGEGTTFKFALPKL